MSIEGTLEQQSGYTLSSTASRIIVLFIILIMAAEMLIYFDHVQAGLILHIIILFLLTFSIIWISETNFIRSVQVLLLLSLFRFLNLSMPVFSEMTLDTLSYMYIPMLLPAYLVIRYQGLHLSDIRVPFKKLPAYLLLSCVAGAIIAWGEFQIIRPESLIPDLSLINILKLCLIMIFVVGFVEELIFRFLLQTRMELNFGNLKGLIIASLLFGFMHSGYSNSYEILYASFVGILIGYAFQKTRNLALVTLTRGFVNIFLFGLIPLLPYFGM